VTGRINFLGDDDAQYFETGFDHGRLDAGLCTVINDVLLAPQPTKEFVQIDQIAALAVFLCKDEARSITGANISIDGGWTAQ